jgi:aspartyl-tRNA(Asn)/glutamyl-tRNA(Gln) amidotransferase subunit C
MTAKVTVEEVNRVAELAHLELTADEIPGMVGNLNAILDYVAELNELDTTGVAPLAQITELIRELPGAGGSAELRPDLRDELRPDRTLPSLDRAAVMPEAPESDGRFFKVPKVIER